MTLISEKKVKLQHIIVNLVLTSVTVFAIYYLSGPHVKGLLFHIGAILSMPSFLIVSLFMGPWKAMHSVPFILDKLINFIFYSAVTALIQLVIYKRKKKRQEV